MQLKVNEIFYSLQGEGANMGKAAIFIRLSNCNRNCWFCDTEWQSGLEKTIEEIRQEIAAYPSQMIIWTGGEPTLQLNEEVLAHFSDYYNCIETNGTNPVPKGIDYITCSPKVGVETLNKNFSFVNEFRYPIDKNTAPPAIEDLPKADNYFLSPIFTGLEKERHELNSENVEYCIDFVRKHPQWRLSLQIHKLLKIQ